MRLGGNRNFVTLNHREMSQPFFLSINRCLYSGANYRSGLEHPCLCNTDDLSLCSPTTAFIGEYYANKSPSMRPLTKCFLDSQRTSI